MNIPISPDSALNHYYFRAADRMRIDGCANAVAHEGLSLALYCPFEALLDHYVNLLLARLRQQAPDHRIEVYFPANTDSLLGRFNEVLASQSLNQAVKATATVNQAQVWIVHDAQTLPESEIQLLARLIQNFPGANIRAILLMSGSQNPEKSPLSAFGRKILRWDIEAPTEEQAQAALDLARHEGHFGAVQQLIHRIQRQKRPELDSPFLASLAAAGPETAAAVAPPTPAPAGSSLQQQLAAYQQHGAAALKALGTSGLRLNLTWLRQNIKVVAGVAVALLLSTLMMLWIQPEAFGLKSTQPMATPPPPTLPLPAPSPSMSPPPAPSSQTAKPVDSSTSSAPANALPSAPPTAPVVTATPRVDAAIEVPEATLGAHAWLKKLDASSFLLQHGTSNSYKNVLDIQRKYPALKDAQIVAAYRPGEKLAHFVIVSGPFSEVGQGYEASKRPGIPRSWVRPTRSLQEQLNNPT